MEWSFQYIRANRIPVQHGRNQVLEPFLPLAQHDDQIVCLLTSRLLVTREVEALLTLPEASTSFLQYHVAAVLNAMTGATHGHQRKFALLVCLDRSSDLKRGCLGLESVIMHDERYLLFYSTRHIK